MSGTASKNSRPLESESFENDGISNKETPGSPEIGASVDPEKGNLAIQVVKGELTAIEQDPNESNVVTWDSPDDPENPLKYEYPE